MIRTVEFVLCLLLAVAIVWSTALISIALGALLALLLLKIIKEGASPAWKHPLVVLFVAVTFGRIVSLAASPFNLPIWDGVSKLFYSLSFLVAARLSITDEQLKSVGTLALVAAVIGAGIGMYRVFEGDVDRATISGGYSRLAQILAFAAVACIPVLLHSEKTTTRVATILACLVVTAGVAFTYSRANILSLVAGAGIALFIFRRKLSLYIVPVIVLTIVLIPAKLQERFLDALLRGDSSGRTHLWNIGMDAVAASPFLGYGPESFDSIVTPEVRASLFDSKIGGWHNDFIQIAIESGVPVMLLFLLFLVMTGVRIRREAGRSPAEQRWIWSLASGLLASYLVIALFGNTITDPALGVFLWGMAGLLARRPGNEGALA